MNKNFDFKTRCTSNLKSADCLFLNASALLRRHSQEASVNA